MTFTGRIDDSGRIYQISTAHGRIQEVTALSDRDGASDALPLIVPGLIDIQINGYVGTTFSDSTVTPDDVRHCIRKLIGRGVYGVCPTITTNAPEAIIHSIRTIIRACEADPLVDSAVLGIHLEGPYISSEDGPRGAHERAYVKDPDWEEFCRFVEAAGGRLSIVTIAPEREGAQEFIRTASSNGIVVGLGHTAASPSDIDSAIDAGASLVTHIGNAVHEYLHRHQSYIWEELARDELSASFIADGVHLPDSLIRCVLRCKGPDRSILVSDASGFAGMSPGDYVNPVGVPISVLSEGRIVRKDTGRLSGAATDIRGCLEYLTRLPAVSLLEGVRMATRNPARLLGLGKDRGVIQAGARADFLIVDSASDRGGFSVQANIFGGAMVDEEMVGGELTGEELTGGISTRTRGNQRDAD